MNLGPKEKSLSLGGTDSKAGTRISGSVEADLSAGPDGNADGFKRSISSAMESMRPLVKHPPKTDKTRKPAASKPKKETKEKTEAGKVLYIGIFF